MTLANGLQLQPGMSPNLRRAIMPCIVVAGFAPPLYGRQEAPRPWRWTAGVSLGVLLGPGEIGRARNATGGHEQLIARLGNGMALALQAGFETRFGGLQLRGVSGSSAVQVRNEYGVAFPNHGSRPFAWTGSALLYPFAPILPRRSGLPRPFLLAGVGGMLLSVDLDNVRNQTLYHPFHWMVGGGVRIDLGREASSDRIPILVELRVELFRVWESRPFRHFDAVSATAGVGMRI